MPPLVSVVIPTRDSPATLRRALQSLARQDYAHFEVIVVDDGSSLSVWHEYRRWWAEFDGRFQLLLPVAPGIPGTRQSASRNRGLRAAQGRYLAFLDHDDEWTTSDVLSAAVTALESTRADYFFANMESVRNGVVELPAAFPRAPRLVTGCRLPALPEIYRVDPPALRQLLLHHTVHVNTTIIRRDLLNRVGGFVERLHYYEDLEFMLRLADAARKILYRADVTARYHLPSGNCLTLAQTRLERALQGVYACQHARSVCQSPSVRQCARARQSWLLRRELAAPLRQQGRAREAFWYALEAACVYPTLAGAGEVLKGLARAIGWEKNRGGELSPPPPVAEATARKAA